MPQTLDILLADLQYVRSEFVRNEEVGEKRFGFFVTLVTAVIAGLVAVGTSEGEPHVTSVANVLGVTALLIFGLLTYIRLIHRNKVADHLKWMSDNIREQALRLCPKEETQDTRLIWPRWTGLSRRVRAGYAEVIGATNGALFGGFLAVVLGLPTWVAALAGLATAAVLWAVAIEGRRRAKAALGKA